MTLVGKVLIVTLTPEEREALEDHTKQLVKAFYLDNYYAVFNRATTLLYLGEQEQINLYPWSD